METNFYIRTDGNDNNDGLEDNAEHAFRTLQGAIDKYMLRYKPSPYDINFNMTVPGEYGPVVINGNSIGKTVYISGIESNPTGAQLSSDALVMNLSGGSLKIKNIKLNANSTNNLAHVIFNSGHLFTDGNISISSASRHSCFVVNGTLSLDGNISISGNFANSVISARSGLAVVAYYANTAFNLNGTTAGYFTDVWGGVTSTYARTSHTISFTGSYTITRKYNLYNFGTINTVGAGENYLPGTNAGIKGTYVAYT